MKNKRWAVGLAGVLLVVAWPWARASEERPVSELAGIPEALPGAPPLGDEWRKKLAEKLAALPENRVPRTRHLREDGSPLYTNRLLLESSPYLQQHAHNPVNWYPWGDEAFETARRLNRPVLLSIGYSTCHWCHVMEEESFEDVEVATVLNELYIAIKVDREVRPDVDAIYMQAVQLMSQGRGGWPLNAWLTPDRKPFYGGTYFPARDGDRGVSAGFLTVLKRLSEIYQGQPDRVAQATEQITAAVKAGLEGGNTAASKLPSADVLTRAARFYTSRFDPTHGGIGQAPKFPSSLPVRFLLREHRRTGEQAMLKMATLTLRKMAEGGMYDQAGGGFHRYSVDERWLVPHFEKMLYDNALLVQAYVEAWQAGGDEFFARIAREILRYVGRDMTAPGGAFYSATDADSRNPEGHMEEGWFFTWTPAELRATLPAKSAELVIRHYGVTSRGNFEGRTILHVSRPLDEVAAELELSADEAGSLLAAARDTLYEARKARPAPLRDDKILTAWNGLMISAFAQAGLALDEPEYTRAAARAADFVLKNLRVDGRLRRSFKDGQAQHPAFVEDHAFLIAGLLDLHEADGDPRWIRESIALQALLDRHHADPEAGGYFTTADDHEKLLAREKPAYDGAEPSGNSVAARNLLRLGKLTTDDAYRARADNLLLAFGALLDSRPGGVSEMLLALDFRLDTPKEIIIVHPGGKKSADRMLDRLRGSFVPNRVLAVVPEGDGQAEHAELIPMVKDKVAQQGKVTAYVCENGVCRLPTTDPEAFAAELFRKAGSPGEPGSAAVPESGG